jgi:CheY-like chemotaxis protein
MALRDLAGVHVLVVEDTDDSREVLKVVLEYCGALVTTAESAEKAKRILETIRPHVLVTDIAMPDDGLELIREVKAVAETKGIHIPAIAITAYRDRREAGRRVRGAPGKAAGSDHVVRGRAATRPALVGELIAGPADHAGDRRQQL